MAKPKSLYVCRECEKYLCEIYAENFRLFECTIKVEVRGNYC